LTTGIAAKILENMTVVGIGETIINVVEMRHKQCLGKTSER